MNKNRLIQAIAALAVVGVLILATPKAAHSLAAALVEVANTPSSPAVTQSVPTIASQIVTLEGNADNCLDGTILIPSGVVGELPFNVSALVTPQSLASCSVGSTPPYTVPAGNKLVITTVEAGEMNTGTASGKDNVFFEEPNNRFAVLIQIPYGPNATVQQLHFNPGIVFQAGEQVQVDASQLAFTGRQLLVVAHGYLTSN